MDVLFLNCNIPPAYMVILVSDPVAEWEYPDFHANCALGDKLLQFDMVLCIGKVFKNHRIQVGVAPWWPICAKSNMAAETHDLK